MISSSYPESYFPCTIEYKDYSNVIFTTGSDYQVEGVVSAFEFNQTIQTVNLPDSIKNIGVYSFAGSTLNNIALPEGLTSIGTGAFISCSGLTSIILPSSLTSIGYMAFDGCSGLTSIILPEDLTSIGDLAFYDCSGLTGELNLGECTSLTSIGNYAFYNCSSLTGELNLGECTSLTSIEVFAFYMCSGLESITLPESLTSIGNFAFSGCRGLKEVIIDSEYVYDSATSDTACGYVLFYATTVKVLTSLDDGTNSHITANFTKGENDVIGEKNYTVYSK